MATVSKLEHSGRVCCPLNQIPGFEHFGGGVATYHIFQGQGLQQG
jgi:hypothetical protein